MTPAPDLTGLLFLAALVVTFGYIAVCAGWPFKACRRCHGAGKLRPPMGRAVRYCPRCRGTGLRLRPARKLWNHLTRLHRDSTR